MQESRFGLTGNTPSGRHRRPQGGLYTIPPNPSRIWVLLGVKEEKARAAVCRTNLAASQGSLTCARGFSAKAPRRRARYRAPRAGAHVCTFAAREELGELIYRGGRDIYQLCVCVDVLDTRHANQSCGDSWRRPYKLQGALGIVFKTQSLGYKRREIARDLALQQRRAGNQRNSQFACGFHYGAVAAADGLISQRQRFRHSQVEGEL